MSVEQPPRVISRRPAAQFDSMQPFDFGIPETDYEWKAHGAQRLMYQLVETDRYERLKVNGRLPDHVLV